MSESKTKATALVTLTVSVELTQPWDGTFTLEQVQKQAREDALRVLGCLGADLAKRGVRVGDVRSVRIVLNEEKLL